MKRLTLALVVVLMSAGAAAAQDKANVKLQTVNYDGLKNAVLQHRGKVVFVDFWGFF